MMMLKVKEELKRISIKEEIAKFKNSVIKPKQVAQSEQIRKLVDYKKMWKVFSKDCDRVNNLFNNDPENTYKHIEYLNHLEVVRANLKKLAELDYKYEDE